MKSRKKGAAAPRATSHPSQQPGPGSGIRNRVKEFRTLKVRELRANPLNWRMHPLCQEQIVRAALNDVGFADVVLAFEDPEQGLTLIDGHLRREIIERSDPEMEVPVVILDVTREEAAKLLASIDPMAGMAETNDQAYAELLKAIAPGDSFLSDFFEQQLKEAETRLANLGKAGLSDPDEVPEPPEQPVAQPGDLWLLGQHRLLCGDSTSAADVARLLAGEKPRLMITDPPYGISLDMEWRDRAGHNALGGAEPSYMRRQEGHRNTTISGDTKADWSDAFELVPSLDVAYVWHASTFAIEVGLGLRRIGFELKQQIIWNKAVMTLSRQHYHWKHEPCWYARKPGSAPFIGSRNQTTVWDAASPKMAMGTHAEEKVDHPTQKPAVLYTAPLLNHLKAGEPVYEPFSGSGTAIIAAEQSQRRCYAMEIDPKYVDVAVNRWEAFSGKKAERIAAKGA